MIWPKRHTVSQINIIIMSAISRNFSTANMPSSVDMSPIENHPSEKINKDILNLCKEIMSNIKTLGETPNRLGQDIVPLIRIITKEFNKTEYFNKVFLMTIRAIIYEQPHKQPIIAMLLLILSTKNIEIIKEVIDFLLQEFQKRLSDVSGINEDLENDVGPWTKIKLLLRFFSLISPLFKVKDILTMYNNLFELSIQMNKKVYFLSEQILKNTIINIPFLFFFDRKNKILLFEILNLINKTETFIKIVEQDIELLDVFCFRKEGNGIPTNHVTLKSIRTLITDDFEQLDKIFPKWNHMINIKDIEKYPKPIKLSFPNSNDIICNQDKRMDKYSVDELWRYSDHETIRSFPQKLQDSDVISFPNLYQHQLMNDNIRDIVQSMEFNKTEVARQVLLLDVFYDEGLFKSVVLPTQEYGGKQSENIFITSLEGTIVKTILDLLFRLPFTTIPLVYYFSLLLKICKNSTKIIAPLFGKAFRYFYQNLCILDFESTLVYDEWFRIQLTNFGYSWKWDEWTDDYQKLYKQTYNPKRIFQTNSIRRLLNSTSNTYDFKINLPVIFQPIFDDKFFNDSSMKEYLKIKFVLDYKKVDIRQNGLLFLQTHFPFHENVEHILKYMHKNDKDKNSLDTLNLLCDQIEIDFPKVFKNFQIFKILLLTQCICHCGRRSLSHANKYIHDFGNELFKIFNSIELKTTYKEFIVLDSIIRYWNSNARTGFILVDSFKHYDLISNETILDFLYIEIGQEYKVITDYAARQCLLKTLDDVFYSGKANSSLFIRAYILTLKIILESLKCIDVDDQTVLDIEESILIKEEYSQKDNHICKYFEGLKLMKCLLRKYFVIYREMAEVLLDIFKEYGLTHIQTTDQIAQWITETGKLE